MWLGLAFKGVMTVAGAWWVFDTTKDFAQATPEERDYMLDNPIAWLGGNLLDKTAKTAMIPILTILMYMGYAVQRSLIQISDTAYRDIAEEEQEIEYTKTYLAYPALWDLGGYSFDFDPKIYSASGPVRWRFVDIDATIESKGKLVRWNLHKGGYENDFSDVKWRVITYVHGNYQNLIGSDDEYWVGRSNYNWTTRSWNQQSTRHYGDDMLVGDSYFSDLGMNMFDMISGPRLWSFTAAPGSLNNTNSEQDGNHPLNIPTGSNAASNHGWEIVGCNSLPWIRFSRGTFTGTYYPDDMDLDWNFRLEYWNTAVAET